MDLFRRLIYGSAGGVPPAVSLIWSSPYSGQSDEVCTNPLCNFIISINTSDSDNDIVNTVIQKSLDGGGSWITYIANQSSGTFSDSIMEGSQMYRAICTDKDGQSTISNVLAIFKNRTEYPLINFYYEAIHPEGHIGFDTVVYLDKYGDTQEENLVRSFTDESGFHPAPCTLIIAKEIVSNNGCITCLPD